MGDNHKNRLIVAITGASGSIYAIRFLEAILEQYDQIHLTVTENAVSVIQRELGLSFPIDKIDTQALLGKYYNKISIFHSHELIAPPASGSVDYDGMVIVPCSMGTVGRIASGVSNDLVTRAADVCLKERRKLILVIRETPLNLIHLRNLTKLTEAGAVILPASPAFYCNPKTIEDLVSFVVARILQQLGLKQDLVPEWEMQE